MESSQKSDHLTTGTRGEKIAAEFLRSQGYLILEQNWTFGHRELDIIAMHSHELVVVEVKTRHDPMIDDLNLVVNRKKQRNIVSAANAYIRYNRINLDVRFDIIWIRFLRDGAPVVEHIQDAFIPLL